MDLGNNDQRFRPGLPGHHEPGKSPETTLRTSHGERRVGRLHIKIVTIPTVTLTRKVGPGLQDLQTRARRILAERNAQKAEENTWIGRMVATESIGELDGLIRSRAA